jgi:hypothetical protein
MIPRTILFGDNRQTVLTGSENLQQLDSVKKYVSKFIILLAGFAGKGVLNKDPTIWLDGARSPPKYISK